MATENEEAFCVELVGCGTEPHPATRRVTWDDGRPSIDACRRGAFGVLLVDPDEKVTIEQIDQTTCACGSPAEYRCTYVERNTTQVWYVCCGDVIASNVTRERL